MKKTDAGDLKILLDNVDIFKVLPENIKSELKNAFSVVTFPEETPVIFQNQSGEAFYLVFSGRLDVLVTESEKTKKIASAIRGEYFGEMSLLTGAKATATVKSATEVKLFRLSKNNFSSLVMNQPRICDLLADVLAKRKTNTELLKRRLKFQPLPEKKEKLSEEKLSEKIKAFLGIGK
ncbi:MAG: cyclic nucleotide-binding domain-containing protein [Elusimicrobia bacterium]|jgi:CRP-like cAMP-binding protein|nr:cyclic nucleotide-binding domain-containing protein [Elusimicrobiota bacterium]